MFKEILIHLIEINNINQRQLASGADIPTTTISGWLNNNKLPDYTAIKKLAIFFDVATDYLLDNQEIDNRKKRLAETINQNFAKPKDIKLIKEINELSPDKQKILFDTIYQMINSLKEL